MKKGQPKKLKLKEEIRKLVDEKGLNFEEVRRILRMKSRQAVYYHYYNP